MKKYNIAKKFLIREYSIKEKSVPKLSKNIGCSVTPIYNALKKYNIPIRTNSEAHRGKLASNYNPERHKKYYCKEHHCSNEIGYWNWFYRNRRCQSCASIEQFRKFGHPMKDRSLSKRTKNEIRKKALKRFKDPKDHPNYGKHLSKAQKKKLGLSVKIAMQAPEIRKKMRENHPDVSGSNNSMFGKPCLHTRKGSYKGIWMRSMWEIDYAKYLDKNNIKWQYEPKRFNLENITYLPDFYLPEKNSYVEIKGWMSSESYFKIKKFLETFPNIELQILMESDLKKLGIL